MYNTRIKEIGNWIIDFELQAAYLMVETGEFHCWDYRTKNTDRVRRTFHMLPYHVQAFLKAKYPNIDSVA